MKVGLIGHRGAGKTTVFNMLTGLQAQVGGYGGKEEIHLGVIKVPDARVDKRSQVFKPKKTTYAEIRFTDFPPTEGENDLKSNNALITQMREVDAIALVLRAFGPDNATEDRTQRQRSSDHSRMILLSKSEVTFFGPRAFPAAESRRHF